MKSAALALLAGLLLAGCQTAPVQRSLPVGATPESVTKGFGGAYYVTLMGTSRKLGDGDGKIARVQDDKVTVITEGLDDPKGIVFVGNRLITADFDKVWSVDAKGKKTLLAGPSAFPTPPTFLNDVVVSPDKKSVLITDMGAVTKMRGPDGKLFDVGSAEHKAIPVIARVFQVTLEGKVTEVIAPTPKMLNPNGIDVMANGRIRIAEFFTGDVLEYNKGKWKTLAKGHRSGDGIVHDSKGRFYVSEVMTGRVTRYEADGSGQTELGQGLKAAADHYLDEKAGLLIVPDSKAGELVFLAL
ncbi:MAG: SMP-30/gluconolactonase/LRE family protein [Verrucomicrobiota bacterium]